MKKIVLIILLCSSATVSLYGQSIALNLKSFSGLCNNEETAYYNGGGGMEILYEHPLKKGSLRGGLVFRSINWGNQLSLNIAYKMPYIVREKWYLSGITSTGIGLALFRDNSLLVWSVGYMPEFTWPHQKKVNAVLGLGLRYTHNPAYKKYGKINQVLEFPIKIGVRFNFKKGE